MGKPPDFDHLRIFGCLCFAHDQRSRGNKFAPWSRCCVFVCYPNSQKGWKLYDRISGDIFVSRDVQFHESEFPFTSVVSQAVSSPASLGVASVKNEGVVVHDLDVAWEAAPAQPVAPSTVEITEPAATEPAASLAASPASMDAPLEGADPSSAATHLPPDVVGRTDPSRSSTELGRGMRTKHPSVLLKEFVTHTVLSPSSPSPSSSGPRGSSYLLAHYVNCANFSMRHRAFLSSLITGVEPRTFKEALSDPGWCEAMAHEIAALEANGIWVMAPLPPDKKTLGCKWVYKIKYNTNGIVERLKVRLVILGNHQVAGIDYHETFASVAKMVTVRTFLVEAASRNWELHQMDVHNAFLHGDLDVEVYMKMPHGFYVGQPGIVCKLRKSLYGLRQAPRCWFAKLATSLLAYGFSQSYSDYSLFIIHKGPLELYVLVYVDDLIVAGNYSSAVSAFKAYLSRFFT
ncbi:transmembrane signal receptor [Lithospermum erythrorhizon]|uniref:Transmembrane signal receptor n=1 Tax=Lithospermum erythrorhizon TaxID=34254 RepID=A0AAV3P3W0_LITER